MKRENQLGILKIVAHDFNDWFCSSRIITSDDGKNLMLEITRDFITKVVKCYTAEEIIHMSLKYGGDIFKAVLNDLSETSEQQIKEGMKDLM